MRTQHLPARGLAFTCVALVFRRERLDELLKVLPAGRRGEIQECLAEASGWTEAELTKQLTLLRQADIDEAARRCGQSGIASAEILPAAFERWLQARAGEFDDRENH